MNPKIIAGASLLVVSGVIYSVFFDDRKSKVESNNKAKISTISIEQQIMFEYDKWGEYIRSNSSPLIKGEKTKIFIEIVEMAIKNNEKCCYILLVRAKFVQSSIGYKVGSDLIKIWGKPVPNHDIREIIVILAEGAKAGDENCQNLLKNLSIDLNSINSDQFRQTQKSLAEAVQSGNLGDEFEALKNQDFAEGIIFYQNIGYMDPVETPDWMHNSGPRILKERFLSQFATYDQWAKPLAWKGL